MATAICRGLRGVYQLRSLFRISPSTECYTRTTGIINKFGHTLDQTCKFTASPQHFSETEKDEVDHVEEEEVTKEVATGFVEVVDVDTSIRYLESKAYQITYGDAPVWVPYRRNHKGAIPPEKTRKTCIRGGKIATGNPCPICRDKYLVLDPKNVALLRQFISPQSGEVISYQQTGVCRKQHQNVLIAMQQAWDQGYIDKPIPPREYDYSKYYPEYKQQLKALKIHTGH